MPVHPLILSSKRGGNQVSSEHHDLPRNEVPAKLQESPGQVLQ
jgi:hypothetical protein